MLRLNVTREEYAQLRAAADRADAWHDAAPVAHARGGAIALMRVAAEIVGVPWAELWNRLGPQGRGKLQAAAPCCYVHLVESGPIIARFVEIPDA